MSAADRVGEQSLAALLSDHPFDDDEGLVFAGGRSVTAGEVRRGAAEVARWLLEAGVAANQAVAVRLANVPEFVIAMFGVWTAGAVFVPLNPRTPPAAMKDALDALGPSAVIEADDRRLITTGRQTFDDDVAFVTWTSGTTGRPRPILQTHSGYLELLDRVLGPLRGGGGGGSGRPMPNLIPVSLSLNAGLYNALFGLRAGSALVLMEEFSTGEFAGLVSKFAIRSTVLPPAALVMLTQDEAVADLDPLRYVRSITAPLSARTARRFTEKFGVTVLNGYGQAEIGEVIGWTAADAREHPEKIGAVGRAHPGVSIRVVGENGKPAEAGQLGELLVKPPRMAVGYADGSGLEDRLDPQGYIRTGDYARIDDDGFVWIDGRVSDMINRGGHKVFPDEVEDVLRMSARVADAAVVGLPDERLGEVPVAFVVGDAAAPELEALCREHLLAYKVPVSFERVSSLPRNEVGKVLRRVLVDTHGPGKPGSSAGP
jgi:long-chain acyl-CoA synthetase